MDLTALSSIVINNMAKVQDPTVITEVCEVIADTSLAYQLPIYMEAATFYAHNQKFPDSDYMKAKFPGMVDDPTQFFSKDLITDLLNKLRTEKVKSLGMKALAEGRFDDMEKIISSNAVCGEVTTFSIDDVEKRYDQLASMPSGILSGVPELDKVLKGVSYGTLNVIGAPPGNFKTTMAVSYAYNATFKNGFNTSVLTFEVIPDHFWYSLMARHSVDMGTPLSAESIKKGLLNAEEREALSNVVADFKANCKGKIDIVSPSDLGGFSVRQFDNYLTQLTRKWGSIDLLEVDYLQRMKMYKPKGMTVDETLNYYVLYFTSISTSYKLPADENVRGMAVNLLVQVNREGWKSLDKKKRVALFSFAEANEIERSASTAIALHSTDAMKAANQLDIYVLKNRSGATVSDPISTFVDPDHFIVGDTQFEGVFTLDTMQQTSDEFFD